MKKQYLEVGKIVGTHGIRGDIKVFPWCNDANFICEFKKLYLDDLKELKVLSSRVHKNISIIKIEGIDSINQAELLKNKILYINRNDARLEKNEYFIQDLIGMSVCNIDNGEKYGELTDVINTGANDIYQVKGLDNEKEYLVPVINDVVKEIDTDRNVIYIRPMKGIFDDAD